MAFRNLKIKIHYVMLLTTYRTRLDKREDCKKCPRTFFFKEEYEQHLELHEEGGVTCDQCGKLYAPHQAKNHQATHLDQAQFVCSTCGKSFKYVFICYSYCKTTKFCVPFILQISLCSPCPWGKRGHLDLLWFPVTRM